MIPSAEPLQRIQTAVVFPELVLWSHAPALGSFPGTGKRDDKEELFAPQTEEAPGWTLDFLRNRRRQPLKHQTTHQWWITTREQLVLMTLTSFLYLLLSIWIGQYKNGNIRHKIEMGITLTFAISHGFLQSVCRWNFLQFLDIQEKDTMLHLKKNNRIYSIRGNRQITSYKCVICHRQKSKSRARWWDGPR